MKFALICEVDSPIELSGEVVVRIEGREYSFVPDGTGTLKHIKVSSAVERPERFSIGSVPHPTYGPTFAMGSDGELYEALTHDLQEVESLLAFSCNLTKIHWEHPREERIADRPGESNFAFHLVPEHQDARIVTTEEDLTCLLNNKQMLRPLTVVKSFWREARNAYIASRYISAFVNSFFILEGLYGNGKFSKKQLCAEFLAYPPFIDAAERVFAMVQDECPEHLHKLRTIIEKTGKTFSVEEFAELLVETRAELSHFISRDVRKRARLFEESYWSVSFVCLKLATLLIEHQSDLLIAAAT